MPPGYAKEPTIPVFKMTKTGTSVCRCPRRPDGVSDPLELELDGKKLPVLAPGNRPESLGEAAHVLKMGHLSSPTGAEF